MRSEEKIRELLRKLEEIQKKIDETYTAEYSQKGGVPIEEAMYCLKCGKMLFKYQNGKVEGTECDHYDYHLRFMYMCYDDIEPAIKVLKWILGELYG
mgnify:CR=1 FL=1